MVHSATMCVLDCGSCKRMDFPVNFTFTQIDVAGCLEFRALEGVSLKRSFFSSY